MHDDTDPSDALQALLLFLAMGSFPPAFFVPLV